MYRTAMIAVFIVTRVAFLYAGPFDVRISKMQFFGADNSLIVEMSMFYDNMGNIVKIKQFDYNSLLVGIEEYVCDEEGKRTREEVYSHRRELENYTVIEYPAGKRIRRSYDMDDILVSTTQDEYDTGGRVTKIVEYSPSGEVMSISSYSYRDGQEIICRREIRKNDWDYYYIIRFSASGMISEVTYYTPDGAKTGHVKFFFEKGPMSEESLKQIIY